METIKSQESESANLRLKVVSTEERYRSLFDQASEGIILAAASDLSIIELNQTAGRLLGLSKREFHPPPFSAFCQLNSSAGPEPKNGSNWFTAICAQRQLNIVRRDGGVTPVEVDGAPINLEYRPAYQFFIREMTDRAHLEQQLRQAEKLSALGQMISGIAHELNNPLAVIKGYCWPPVDRSSRLAWAVISDVRHSRRCAPHRKLDE